MYTTKSARRFAGYCFAISTNTERLVLIVARNIIAANARANHNAPPIRSKRFSETLSHKGGDAMKD